VRVGERCAVCILLEALEQRAQLGSDLVRVRVRVRARVRVRVRVRFRVRLRGYG
jgi:hypothetical protein